jgi:hypothetical protein
MPKAIKINTSAQYILGAFAIVVLVALATQIPQPAACTNEAMVCPDGTAVGRVGANCDFAPCPNCDCPSGYVQSGSTCNPECYYSDPQCLQPSIQCRQTNSCLSDADCAPAQCCHPTSCVNSAFRGVCNLACTSSCEGPLDCGAGSCGCVNGICTVVAA